MTTAHDYFGAMAESYDSLIRRAVPRYAEMLEELITYLPEHANRIVELGCGTGNLSIRLADRWPAADLTLIDAAAEMIDVTRNRLGATHPALAARTRFRVTRFEDWSEDKTADLITSSISLHHVRDKRALYAAIRRALKDGGRLVFADQLRGNPEPVHQVNWQRWIEHCRTSCSADELASLVEHADAHDHYVPLSAHFEMMTAAGFQDIDCVWRHGMWGIVTASAG